MSGLFVMSQEVRKIKTSVDWHIHVNVTISETYPYHLSYKNMHLYNVKPRSQTAMVDNDKSQLTK